MIGHSNAAAGEGPEGGISLPRFARLLALCALGLAALLSLGVRGVVLVQSRLSPASGTGIREPAAPPWHRDRAPVRANVPHGSVASTKTADDDGD